MHITERENWAELESIFAQCFLRHCRQFEQQSLQYIALKATNAANSKHGSQARSRLHEIGAAEHMADKKPCRRRTIASWSCSIDVSKCNFHWWCPSVMKKGSFFPLTTFLCLTCVFYLHWFYLRFLIICVNEFFWDKTLQEKKKCPVIMSDWCDDAHLFALISPQFSYFTYKRFFEKKAKAFYRECFNPFSKEPF